MSAYRFCRTDDIGLLVDALNRCWAPHVPDEPPVTAASFKRSIRDLQVWCSSCMVAFAGADPVGVLIGAKRASGTLIHRIAVHPDHLRQGHGRHLLASLGSKLAILGPPRIVAEIPEEAPAARALFRASGYTEEAVLTDYLWTPEPHSEGAIAGSDPGQTPPQGAIAGSDPGLTPSSRQPDAGKGVRPGSDPFLVVPVSVDDLAANGLVTATRPVAWARSVETLTARKDEIEGLALVSDEGIDAYVLYLKDSPELIAVRTVVEDDGTRLARLLSHLAARAPRQMQLRRVHPEELPPGLAEQLGFRAVARHILHATIAGTA